MNKITQLKIQSVFPTKDYTMDKHKEITPTEATNTSVITHSMDKPEEITSSSATPATISTSTTIIPTPASPTKTVSSVSTPTRQFYRRQLPEIFVDFSSEEGKKMFTEALLTGHMNCYFVLAAQFVTQDEPSFCGLSTLVMVLNTLAVDPGKVWKGAWRWYHETMLDCCIPIEVVLKEGITFGQFTCLANCNHLDTEVYRADQDTQEHAFRDVIKEYTQRDDVIIVVSYSRKLLHQTGSGHFTTIGGYHEETDKVLILDVARFKYPSHWVTVSMLFESMKEIDKVTGLPRGYMLLKRRTDISPLILFRISDELSVVPDQHCDTLSFINRWQCFLSKPIDPENPDNPEYPQNLEIEQSKNLLSYVMKNLLQLIMDCTGPVCVFKMQINCECSEELLKNCKCLLRRSISDFKKSDIHKNIACEIGKISESCDGEKFMKIQYFGDSAEFNCCGILDEGRFIHAEDFIVMFVLCWPYRKKENSVGNLLSYFLGDRVENFGAVIRNEINALKNQFMVLLEVWKEGKDFSCRAKECCFVTEPYTCSN